MRLKIGNFCSDGVLFENYRHQKFKRLSRFLTFKLQQRKKTFLTSDQKRLSFLVHYRQGRSWLNKIGSGSSEIQTYIESPVIKNFIRWYNKKIIPSHPDSLLKLIQFINCLQFSSDTIRRLCYCFFRSLSKHFFVGTQSIQFWINKFQVMPDDSLYKTLMLCQPKSYFEPFCCLGTRLSRSLNSYNDGIPFISQWVTKITKSNIHVYLFAPLMNVVYQKSFNFAPFFIEKSLNITKITTLYVEHKEFWLCVESKDIRQFILFTFHENRIMNYDYVHCTFDSNKESSLRNTMIFRHQINRRCNVSQQNTYIRPCLLTFSKQKFSWFNISEKNFSLIISKSIFRGFYSYHQDSLIVVLPLINKKVNHGSSEQVLNLQPIRVYILHPISLKQLVAPKLIILPDYDKNNSDSIFNIEWDRKLDNISISYIGFQGIHFYSSNKPPQPYQLKSCEISGYPISYAYDSIRSILYYQCEQDIIFALKIESCRYFGSLINLNQLDQFHPSVGPKQNKDSEDNRINRYFKIDSHNDVLYLLIQNSEFEFNQQHFEDSYKSLKNISTLFHWQPIEPKALLHPLNPLNPLNPINNLSHPFPSLVSTHSTHSTHSTESN